MREVSVSAIISAPREEVFDFVADLAARPAFTEHFMDDYRLARVQPVGVGRPPASSSTRRSRTSMRS